MDVFIRAAAAVLLTVIMVLTLGMHNKHTAILLVIAVCAMIGIIAISYLQPVMEFIGQLRVLGKLDNGMLQILIKAVGIGFIGELTCLICADTGNAALGKVLQMLCAAVILRLSLPLFEQLLKLLDQILGEV